MFNFKAVDTLDRQLEVLIAYFLTLSIVNRYRIAFRETLLCRQTRRRDSRVNFDLTSCRETPLPSYRSQRRKRESRIAFISKVDFVKEDPSMFCGEDLKEDAVIYLYNDVKTLSLGCDAPLK
ncbi:hypothetical protein O0L34_g10417 [Tuta absoluta]|nr:hypothetical protein O0L34_g10417 [Tuta absoluta]